MRVEKFKKEEGNEKLFKINEMDMKLMEVELEDIEFLLLKWKLETDTVHNYMCFNYANEHTELKNVLYEINRACVRLLVNNYSWSKYDFRTTYFFEEPNSDIEIRYVPIEMVPHDFSKIKELVYNEMFVELIKLCAEQNIDVSSIHTSDNGKYIKIIGKEEMNTDLQFTKEILLEEYGFKVNDGGFVEQYILLDLTEVESRQVANDVAHELKLISCK